MDQHKPNKLYILYDENGTPYACNNLEYSLRYRLEYLDEIEIAKEFRKRISKNGVIA